MIYTGKIIIEVYVNESASNEDEAIEQALADIPMDIDFNIRETLLNSEEYWDEERDMELWREK